MFHNREILSNITPLLNFKMTLMYYDMAGYSNCKCSNYVPKQYLAEMESDFSSN